MPVKILSDADKDHFNRFPTYILEEDINAFFTLSDSDKREVDKQRGQQNQLGFAMQLCALRYMGFSPDNLNTAPPEIVGYVAEQLAINPQVLTDYGKRIATRTTHLQQIQSYLGFHKANKEDMQALSTWLLLRALEHDKSTLLLQLACEKLLKDRIVRPGLTQLERIVANAQSSATKEIFRQLKPLLTPEIIKFLDGLLIPSPSTGRTELTWLRKGAISNSAKEMLRAIKKLSFLRKPNVDKWNLSYLNPNRQKTLARIGRKGTNQYLQRLVEERRYPILTAFLKQSLVDIVDEIIDMFIQALWDLYQDSKKDMEIFQKSSAQSANEKLKMFKEMGHILLNPEVTNADVRPVTFNHIPPDILRKALDDTDKIVRPHGDDHIDFFARRYNYIRQFSPSFLNALDFKSDSPHDPLLRAINLIRQLNLKKGKRVVPKDAPIGFVSEQWKPYIVNRDKSINTCYYELCVLWELRNALRACNIWVEDSRKYANLDSYFIPPKEWSKIKPEVCALINAPEDGRERLKEREDELTKLIPSIDKLLTDKNNNQWC